MHYILGLQMPSDVATRVLAAIKSFEAQGLHIFVEVQEEDVMRQARASDARHKAGKALSLFDGVLVAVKVGCAPLCHIELCLSPPCLAGLPSANRSYVMLCCAMRSGHGGHQRAQHV